MNRKELLYYKLLIKLKGDTMQSIISKHYGLSPKESVEYSELSKIDLREISDDQLNRYKELARKVLNAVMKLS